MLLVTKVGIFEKVLSGHHTSGKQVHEQNTGPLTLTWLHPTLLAAILHSALN
jgi:hypothetical protein